MNLSNVKKIVIPEGIVTTIKVGDIVIWKKTDDTILITHDKDAITTSSGEQLKFFEVN